MSTEETKTVVLANATQEDFNIYALCAKEPHELTEAEVAQVVDHLRKEREKFAKLAAEGKTPAARKASGGKAKASKEEVDSLLSDLL